MSISLGANGGSYSYPQENDPAGWGDDATNWASAVSAALGNIGLGGTVSATSLIDMSGTTTKGFLPPKLTTVQRNAISTPPAGLVIYNTTTSQLEVYTGSSWFSVASSIDGNLTVNGNSTLNGTLTVTGTTSLASVTGTGLTVNGSTTLNGALTVTGATSLQSLSSLNVTGNTTLVNVTGANITSTGTILAASGTSGTPGISFSGDPDTGIYNSAANQISFSTGGVERFRIESTGQLKAVYESTLGTDYNTTLDNGYLCRAWVNFNGGTVVSPASATGIRGSGNVSTILDNAVGDYTVNMTVGLPDINYSIVCGASTQSGLSPTAININRVLSNGLEQAPTTSSFRLNVQQPGGSAQDPIYVCVAVFR